MYYYLENYTMKCRLYPNNETSAKIDHIFDGIRSAYNTTLYELVTNKTNAKKSSKSENYYPDFSAMMKKAWLDELREMRPIVKDVPAGALNSMRMGIFARDMKKAWESQGRHSIDFWKPKYYSNARPRRSFTVQVCLSSIKETDNSHVFKINIPKVGLVKVRGWNKDSRFDSELSKTLIDYAKENPKKRIFITVSKDSCNDYYISFVLSGVYKLLKNVPDEKVELGVDVGIKDIAILSDGAKYENKKFKNGKNGEVQKHRKILCRRLSRREGFKNEEFRAMRKSNKELQPSKTYMRTSLKLAKLERSVTRKRLDYNNNITTDIVRKSSFIGIESLTVKGLFRNRHLANALSDAAMYAVLNMIKYKSEWYDVVCQPIDRWTPSSKECNVCGYKNKDMTLSVRSWVCPECGTYHDRDVNAAKNILKYAKELSLN